MAGGTLSFMTAVIQGRTIGTDTVGGVKEEPENFHHGTPAAAFRAAVELIRDDYERMIERWQR